MALLGTSHKVKLSELVGILTRVLYLAPAYESGINVCQFMTVGCRAACLGHSSGMMVYPTHKRARIRKTLAYFHDRPAFLAELRRDIEATIRAADRAGFLASVRLNGASDLPWERCGIIQDFPAVQFYDYTKNVKRALASIADPSWPKNYRLVFSRSGENSAECLSVLAAGGNVAVVFSTKKGNPLPSTYHGFPVIDGDEHDARFIEAPGAVVGLRAKGKAKGDRSGFVVTV
jgi:hypothetical protein